METITQFFSNMDTFQWALLAAGAWLLWPQLSKLGSKMEDTEVDTDVQVEDKEENKLPEVHDHDLTNIVCQWECLHGACHSAGLHDACKKLNEVFPMFIKLHNHEDE